MKCELLLFAVFLKLVLNSHAEKAYCTFPGTPQHARVDIDNLSNVEKFPHNTTVTYHCDPGYLAIGAKDRKCSNGKWVPEAPTCFREMAFSKPNHFSLSSPSMYSTERATDGDLSTCSRSSEGDTMPLWYVDLIDSSEVQLLHIVFGEKPNGATLEFRVGNHVPSTGVNANTICRLAHPQEYIVGVAYYFVCDSPIFGRYVSIQAANLKTVLSLCEVRVLSDSSLAKEDVCSGELDQDTTDSFQNKCVEVITEAQNAKDANEICVKHGGTLLENPDRTFETFISWKLKMIFGSQSPTKGIWLNAVRWKDMSQWKWSSGEMVSNVTVIDEFPNDQCLIVEATKWRSEDCATQNVAICTYAPTSCGTPAWPEKASNWNNIAKLPVNSALEVQCVQDFYFDGEAVKCFNNGSVSRTDYLCLPLNCDTRLNNGTVEYRKASNLATFTCEKGYELNVDKREMLCLNGNWSSTIEPKCVEKKVTPTVHQETDILHDAINHVNEVRDALGKVSFLANLSSQVIEWLVFGIVILLIVVVLAVGVCIWLVRRRKRETKVTLSQAAQNGV